MLLLLLLSFVLLLLFVCIYIYIYIQTLRRGRWRVGVRAGRRVRDRRARDGARGGDRKGGWYGWKPSSSWNFSIRVFRARPLIEIRQTAPCRAIRGNSLSVNSTLPPSYPWTRSLSSKTKAPCPHLVSGYGQFHKSSVRKNGPGPKGRAELLKGMCRSRPLDNY